MQILERLGHDIDYPEELTCCGQPAFNSGYWDQTRPIAERVLNRLKDAEAVVIASGSCSIETRGRVVELVEPELVTDPELRPAPPPVRFFERRVAGVTQYLRMRSA